MEQNKVFLIAKSNKPTKWFLDRISSTGSENEPAIDVENCYLDVVTDIGKITEFAGRICYNSGYKGQKNRDSISYHKHIIESKHFSIYGHINYTIKVDLDNLKRKVVDEVAKDIVEDFASASNDDLKDAFFVSVNTLSEFFKHLFRFLSNRKRIYLRYVNNNLYMNISLRYIIETIVENKIGIIDLMVIKLLLEKNEDLRNFIKLLFPDFYIKLTSDGDFGIDDVLLTRPPFDSINFKSMFESVFKSMYESIFKASFDAADDIFEWYNFYIYTSRRTANELIRHNTEYALSQQSTRYVMKDKLKIVDLRNYLELNISDYRVDYFFQDLLGKYFDDVGQLLRKMLNFLLLFANDYGRKEILGFYANFLPNGIDTEMVFSCTKWQFEKIKEQRLTQYADKNIVDLVQKMEKSIQNAYSFQGDFL